MTDVKQWVNLDPAQAKAFVSRYPGLIGDEARVGPVTPKVTFENGQPTSAKVRVLPNNQNEGYSDKERERNRRFDILPSERIAKNLGPIMVESATPIDLPAAGLNKYVFEAKSTTDETCEASRTIEAHRLVEWHYVFTETIIAAGIHFDLKKANQLHDEARAYLAEFGISFEKAPGGGLASLASTDSDSPNAFSSDVDPVTRRTVAPLNAIRSASDRLVPRAIAAKPARFVDPKVGVSILWVSAIANRTVWAKRNLTGNKPLRSTQSSFAFPKPPGAAANWSPGGWLLFDKSLLISLPTDPRRHLWYGLDGGDDRGILRSLTLKWPSYTLTREASHATAFDPKPDKPYGGYYTMQVDLSDQWENIQDLLDQPVVMDVDAFITGSYTGGFTYGTGNVLVVAVTGGFEDYTMNQIFGILMHELGHRFGLASNGDLSGTAWARASAFLRGKLGLEPFPMTAYHKRHTPDQHGDYYDDDSAEEDDKSHQGPHCRSGKGTSDQCVMFGAMGGIRFCSGCQRHLRKVDLSDIRR
ncbi:MAG: hypothetical protein U0414_12765 [Polyangiaceae bacterium]